MRKRPYRSVSVKSVEFAKLAERLSAQPLVIGLDVAKQKNYAAVMNQEREVVLTVRWNQPEENRAFVGFARSSRLLPGASKSRWSPVGCTAIRSGRLSST
jgi:hypothetical protein